MKRKRINPGDTTLQVLEAEKLSLQRPAGVPNTRRSKEFVAAACVHIAGFIYSTAKKQGYASDGEVWEALNRKQHAVIKRFVIEYEKVK